MTKLWAPNSSGKRSYQRCKVFGGRHGNGWHCSRDI